MSEHSGFKGDKKKRAEAKEKAADSGPNVLKLEDDELKRIQEYVDGENGAMAQVAQSSMVWKRAITKAEEAIDTREQFCLHLEKKYDITPGTSWSIDFEAGGILVAPVKSITTIKI